MKTYMDIESIIKSDPRIEAAQHVFETAGYDSAVIAQQMPDYFSGVGSLAIAEQKSRISLEQGIVMVDLEKRIGIYAIKDRVLDDRGEVKKAGRTLVVYSKGKVATSFVDEREECSGYYPVKSIDVLSATPDEVQLRIAHSFKRNYGCCSPYGTEKPFDETVTLRY